MGALFFYQVYKDAMKKVSAITLLVTSLAVAACGKKAVEPAPAPAPVAAPAAPVAAAPAAADPDTMTDAQREAARKQGKLDYATMEDKYINDPRAQWATGANASSTFNNGESESRRGTAAIGPIDGKAWTNNQQDIGFDWIELSYAKPVNATEVRLVSDDDVGPEALTKIELQDTEGKWNTIWSGISDAKHDDRGPRAWVVRSFEKTPYKVKAVKYTFANNVRSGYKEVDAAQLIGD